MTAMAAGGYGCGGYGCGGYGCGVPAPGGNAHGYRQLVAGRDAVPTPPLASEAHADLGPSRVLVIDAVHPDGQGLAASENARCDDTV